jgi:competence protein ComEA
VLQSVFQETTMRQLLCLITLCAHLPLGALEINQASEAELDNLRGVGPAFTRRILAERAQAPFRSWADLMQRVSGMGTSTARKLSAQGLQVEGQVFEPLSEPQPAAKLTP